MRRINTSRPSSLDAKLSHISLCIAGENAFNNDVLTHFIESQAGFHCYFINPSELNRLWDHPKDLPDLLFMDCAAMGNPRVCKGREIDRHLQNDRCKVVCFNLDSGKKVENTCLKRGIKGVIYNNQPVELYIRAAKAVQDGELWFPRTTLEKYLLADDEPPLLPVRENFILTRREQDIVTMLAAGMKNKEIACKLCISPHTVKTHIYNLFKKINVDNRFQAAQWLAKNR